MSLTETVIEGTIQPDGTLVLDDKPNLRPGRVKVVLRQEAETKPLTEDWWQFLQRCRQELEASGAKFMNEEEMQARIEWLHEPDQFDELLRQSDEESQRRETP